MYIIQTENIIPQLTLTDVRFMYIYNISSFVQKNCVVYMDQWITENTEYHCKRSNRGCTWKGAINDYYRDVR